MRRHPDDWTYRSLAAFEKLQHIPHDSHIETVHYRCLNLFLEDLTVLP